MTRYVLMIMLLALPVAAAPAEPPLLFTKLWTHGHTTPGQVSEIPAFDRSDQHRLGGGCGRCRCFGWGDRHAH